MEYFLSILMISAFFSLIKILGFLYQKYVLGTIKNDSCEGVNFTILKEDDECLYIGGKRYILSQMKEIIEKTKTIKTIKFYEGDSIQSALYATYQKGNIIYQSGKIVNINDI